MSRIRFQQELVAVKDRILAMATFAQESVSSALEAYLLRDKQLCEFVKRTEQAINAAQREIDQMTCALLAQEQPMAVDFRFLLAALKINRDLERIGDLAIPCIVGIALVAIFDDSLRPMSGGFSCFPWLHS